MNAKPQPTTFYGVTNEQNWTHVNLQSGKRGIEVARKGGVVLIRAEKGFDVAYQEDQLHLFWAPLNSDSQGEQA